MSDGRRGAGLGRIPLAGELYNRWRREYRIASKGAMNNQPNSRDGDIHRDMGDLASRASVMMGLVLATLHFMQGRQQQHANDKRQENKTTRQPLPKRTPGNLKMDQRIHAANYISIALIIKRKNWQCPRTGLAKPHRIPAPQVPRSPELQFRPPRPRHPGNSLPGGNKGAGLRAFDAPALKLRTPGHRG